MRYLAGSESEDDTTIGSQPVGEASKIPVHAGDREASYTVTVQVYRVHCQRHVRVVVVTVEEAHFVSTDACLLQFFVPALQVFVLTIQSADVGLPLSSDYSLVDLRPPLLADVFCVDQQGKSMLRNHVPIAIYFDVASSRAWQTSLAKCHASLHARRFLP